MSDTTAKNAAILNAPIGGPSHAQLRRPFQQSLDEKRQRQQRTHKSLVRKMEQQLRKGGNGNG